MSSPPSQTDSTTSSRQPRPAGLARIPPLVSATARLDALYALTTGDTHPSNVGTASSSFHPKAGAGVGEGQGSALRRLITLQTQLHDAVASDRGLKRFLNDWEKTSSLLNLGFYPPEINASTTPSPAQLALCLEMEGDLTRAVSDLEEIKELNRRGVVEAKSLSQCETLSPRLLNLVEQDAVEETAFHHRQKLAWETVERYHNQINTISQLFIALDDRLSTLESQVTRVEKRRERIDGLVAS